MSHETPTADELIKGCYFAQDEARRAIAKIKAEAWDEGHEAGDEYGYAIAKHNERDIALDSPVPTLNPYRFAALDGSE